MKKFIFVIVILICHCSMAFSQEAAFFELPLYFEDSIGNKDTIVIGYDERAYDDEINEIFGEMAIDTPFDSVFEVRVYNGSLSINSNAKFFSKKIIINPETILNEDSIHCYLANGAKIVFNAIHLPVKMYYDRDILNSRCIPEASVLWNNALIDLIGVEMQSLPETDYQCLFSADTLILDPRDLLERNEEISIFNYLEDIEVEGGETIQVQGYLITFNAFTSFHTYDQTTNSFVEWTPCEEVDYVGLENLSIEENQVLFLYPNPADDFVYLNHFSGENLDLQLYDFSGKQVINQRLTQNKINLQSLPSGLYLYRVLDKNKNNVGNGKLQKW